MISAVAILMLCNGIRMSPRSEKNTINEIGCVMEFMTHLFRFFIFSSDFTDESEGILAYRITHGFSRNFGRWPMARTRYVLLLFFVPQISRIYTDFSLCGLFRPTDFTDIHRFFFVGYIPLPVGICTDRTGRLRENPRVIVSAGNLRINSVSSDE